LYYVPEFSFILFEFATYLFLAMNATIIYLWYVPCTKNSHAFLFWTFFKSFLDFWKFSVQDSKLQFRVEVTIAAKGQSGKRFHKKPLITWAIWNTVILACFVAFMIAFYTVPATGKTFPCDNIVANANDEAKARVSLGYVIFVVIISFLLAAALIIVGAKYVGRKEGRGKTRKDKKKGGTRNERWTDCLQNPGTQHGRTTQQERHEDDAKNVFLYFIVPPVFHNQVNFVGDRRQ
jgi:hypothetical protein